jgi:hypothetical protein
LGTKQLPVPPDQQLPFGKVHFCASVPPISCRALLRLGRFAKSTAPALPGFVTITRSALERPFR